MAYDALAESVRLIESGYTLEPCRLSRRRRFLPIAVDVDLAADVAMTQFVARIHGGSEWMTHLLRRTDGVWRMLGGGGGGAELHSLLDLPTFGTIGGFGRVEGGASVNLNEGRFPWGARFAHGTNLEVAEEVASVVIDDVRLISVPWHRRVGVVWVGRRPPVVTLRATGGAVLGHLDISDTCL